MLLRQYAICITAKFKQALHCNAIVVMHQHADDLRVDLSLYNKPGVTSGVATERLLLAEMTSVSDFYMKSIPHFAKMFVN